MREQVVRALKMAGVTKRLVLVGTTGRRTDLVRTGAPTAILGRRPGASTDEVAVSQRDPSGQTMSELRMTKHSSSTRNIPRSLWSGPTNGTPVRAMTSEICLGGGIDCSEAEASVSNRPEAIGEVVRGTRATATNTTA